MQAWNLTKKSFKPCLEQSKTDLLWRLRAPGCKLFFVLEKTKTCLDLTKWNIYWVIIKKQMQTNKQTNKIRGGVAFKQSNICIT